MPKTRARKVTIEITLMVPSKPWSEQSLNEIVAAVHQQAKCWTDSRLGFGVIGCRALEAVPITSPAKPGSIARNVCHLCFRPWEVCGGSCGGGAEAAPREPFPEDESVGNAVATPLESSTDAAAEWAVDAALAEAEMPSECRYCAQFFSRFRCNIPDECDCPRCQGMCECEKVREHARG